MYKKKERKNESSTVNLPFTISLPSNGSFSWTSSKKKEKVFRMLTVDLENK